MPKKYRILDNGQGDPSQPGPISSYTVNEYPSREQIAKARTDKARRKPIQPNRRITKIKESGALGYIPRKYSAVNEERGWKQNRTYSTGKLYSSPLIQIPLLSYKKYGTYKGAGSKPKKKK